MNNFVDKQNLMKLSSERHGVPTQLMINHISRCSSHGSTDNSGFPFLNQFNIYMWKPFESMWLGLCFTRRELGVSGTVRKDE